MDNIVRALRTFLRLSMPYFRSEERWTARLLLLAVFGAELALVYVAVAAVNWNARFYNALEGRDWDAFYTELVFFGFIIACAVLAGAAQYYFGQMLQIRWRRWLTANYVSVWMAQGRHYRVRYVAPQVDNIHLRIASDVYLFIQRTLELATGLLGSMVALASFSYILWGLSAVTPVPGLSGGTIPGWLIWGALLYAGLGTLIAHLIGHRLIPLNFNQQRFESDFRFAIVRAADHSEPIALMGGEPVERAELNHRFTNLVANWTRLVVTQTRLVGFVGGYAQASTVVPVLMVAPAYLAGAIPLGSLMQAALAFTRVEGAFAFCISAYPKIAEWKAMVDRLAGFEDAMVMVDESRAETVGTIAVSRTGARDLDISGVSIRLPDGSTISGLPPLGLRPGDRLMITGPSGSGKSTLFRALAGLWPAGSGRVEFPKDGEVLVMPQRPYFPLGTLRTAVVYPSPQDEVPDTEIASALRTVGLSYLINRLDEEADWSVLLSGGEQQRIGIARALIRKPTVLLFDEPVAALSDASGRELYLTLLDKLPETVVLTIDRREVLREYHPKIVELSRDEASDVPRGGPLATMPA
ncbi:ABC transporter ATP-binding protein/permease [Pseudorhodoplanes sp.]|uniref:ABC transporter ATP-binding protein/permease n=1 Tax=Pseudorhodoplanes sp. TaxID=1934341 RepID=UPI002CCB6F8B|nr:ABC transporter ATP-binding protein/permease [Pseudorhodoplanes sp.]HWV51019.1 ABC transporter ATP-binding protein/permease [Pseudorhodoplanes sp.]